MVKRTEQTLPNQEATFYWLENEAAKRQTQTEQYSDHLNNQQEYYTAYCNWYLQTSKTSSHDGNNETK